MELPEHNQRFDCVTVVHEGLIFRVRDAIVCRMDSEHLDIAQYGQNVPVVYLPIELIEKIQFGTKLKVLRILLKGHKLGYLNNIGE